MWLDIYQRETARIAQEQTALLDEARRKLRLGLRLSPLEQSGVLHAMQVLIDNAIGKAKKMLKTANAPVPVSAYEAFSDLARLGLIDASSLTPWNQVVGIRNRIVHDYMNLESGWSTALCRRGGTNSSRTFLAIGKHDRATPLAQT